MKPADALTITLNESNGGNVGDAYVRNDATGKIYGNVATMGLIAYSATRKDFILWNLSVIPAGATITNANFSLNMTSAPSASRIYQVFNTSTACVSCGGGQWYEGQGDGVANRTSAELTWNNQPAAGTQQSNVSSGTTANVILYWNVTNAVVTTFANTTNKNMSLLIKDRDATNATNYYCLFETKENSFVAGRPQLVITYTPAATGTTYNASGSFSLSLSPANTRTYNGVKTSSLSLTESLLISRIATLNRENSFSLSMTQNNFRAYIVNRLSSLSLSESFSNSRIFTGIRTSSLSLSETISSIKSAILNRANSFSLSISQSNSRTYQGVKINSLSLSESFLNSKIFAGIRTSSLSLSEVLSSIKSATLKRSNSFSLSLTQSNFRTYQGVRQPSLSLTESILNIKSATFNKANSFSLSLSESSSRIYNAVRIGSLSLILNETGIYTPTHQVFSFLLSFAMNLIQNVNAYIAKWESVEPYRICSILQQIEDSPFYLCVYDDGTWKVLIKGS